MAIFDPSQRPQNRPKKGLPGGEQKVTKNYKKAQKRSKKLTQEAQNLKPVLVRNGKRVIIGIIGICPCCA